MFFIMALILYFIVQAHHREYKYGFVYDMENGEKFRLGMFFLKGILHLSKNTILIIFSLLVSILLSHYSADLWPCLLIFITCILWRVHKEREYMLLVCLLAAMSILFVWIYGTIKNQMHTPAALCNVVVVIVPTYYVLMHAKGKLCSQKYTILWLLMLLINMFTAFLTCGAEILCLEQNVEWRKNVLSTIKNDKFMGIIEMLYVGIHHTLYPKLLLAKESELGKVLNNFKYDVICPIIIWVIYIIETMMFTFLHPDAPKYKSKDE